MSARVDVEQVLRSALQMMVTGEDAPGVFTEDVTGTTPVGEVNGCGELRAQVSDWRDGLTDVDLVVDGIAVDGTTAMVRWRLAAQHTGVVLVNEDVIFEPSGRRVALTVSSEFSFRDDRICWFRHDYDLDDVLRQLGTDPSG